MLSWKSVLILVLSLSCLATSADASDRRNSSAQRDRDLFASSSHHPRKAIRKFARHMARLT